MDPRRMVQLGIRSPMDRDVRDWTLARGVTIVTAQEAQEAGPAAVAERVRAVLGDGPAYLSFDIDALDPAFAPGTGTPEVGGLATWQVQAILRRLGGVRFAGHGRGGGGAGATTWPRSPRWRRRRSPGSTSPCSARRRPVAASGRRFSASLRSGRRLRRTIIAPAGKNL